MSQKDKSQRKKALYSEEFQEMLDRLEEEDYVDRSGFLGMKKSRLCLEKVRALEKHFEEENKLQPERKSKIAEEVGLEPRQVAIWFQNRRARWKTKQLEREYDHLRASYDALKHDYGSLEQEKSVLLNQLKDLKAKIEARNIESCSTPLLIPASERYTESTSMNVNVPLTVSSMSSLSSTRFDPISSIMSSSSMAEDFQLCEAYQEQLMRMEELGMLNSSEVSCNFFSSVDQAPTLHWQNGSNNDFH